jgi:hypothetical protein
MRDQPLEACLFVFPPPSTVLRARVGFAPEYPTMAWFGRWWEATESQSQGLKPEGARNLLRNLIWSVNMKNRLQCGAHVPLWALRGLAHAQMPEMGAYLLG